MSLPEPEQEHARNEATINEWGRAWRRYEQQWEVFREKLDLACPGFGPIPRPPAPMMPLFKRITSYVSVAWFDGARNVVASFPAECLTSNKP